jgi:hypothetical protein
METVNSAMRALRRTETPHLRSLTEVFASFLPSLTLAEREIFLEELPRLAGIAERRLAEETALYLTTKQLGTLASFNFEIGNHTYTHVHCRSLLPEEFRQEIDRNKAELEGLSGTRVRSFSQPYGSSIDLTGELANHLERSGHQVIFLSESVANFRGVCGHRLDRVNARPDRDDTLFLDLEVLPRLRAVRNRVFRRFGPPKADQNPKSRVN